MDHLKSPEGKQELLNLLHNHIVAHVVPSYLIPFGTSTISTEYGLDLSVEGHVEDETDHEDSAEVTRVHINGNANVELFDVLAANGILHVVDTVLFPQDSMAEPEVVEQDNGVGEETSPQEMSLDGNDSHDRLQDDISQNENFKKANGIIQTTNSVDGRASNGNHKDESNLNLLRTLLAEGEHRQGSAPRSSVGGKMNLRRRSA